MTLITDNIKRDSGEITLDGKEILTMGDELRQYLGISGYSGGCQ